MIVTLILALLVVFAAIKLWQHELWQPHNAWPHLCTNNVKKSFTAIGLLHSLAAWPWWSSPGYSVKILSLKWLKNGLNKTSEPFSLDQFLGLKQWLWTTVSFSFIAWLWLGETSLQNGLLFILSGILLVMVPDLYLLSLKSKKEREIGEAVPYFLDLLTLTLQGGRNLEQALTATTKNYPSTLSTVMDKKLVELGWGRSLDDLFDELKTDIPDADFQHFLSSLLRAKKLGVSLSETLAIQTELLRTRRRQKAEELSRTASVKISVPLVLFIFPALLIIYIGPGILQLLERT